MIVWIVLIVLVVVVGVVIYLRNTYKNGTYKKKILASSNRKNWATEASMQLDTIKLCQPFMNSKYKSLAGDLYTDDRIKQLEDDLFNSKQPKKNKRS